MALNTATSVTDYLKSIGQANDMGSRASIYGKSGINMGTYTGSEPQNVALLSFLKGSGSNASPAPAPASSPAVKIPSATVSSPSSTPRSDFTNSSLQTMLSADAGKAAAQSDAQKALIEYYKGLPSVTDRYTKLAADNGLNEQQKLVDALTKNVMQTEDSVDAVEPSVNQRTGDFLVNEGDRTALVAREKQPILETLNKLLRNKQYEEIGLQGKQALVSNLLNLSLQDDQLRAKPLELGVDYTTEDRNTALSLWKEISGAQISAFNADQSAAEQKAKDANDLAIANGKKATAEAKDKKDAATEAKFNAITAGAKTERDVWNTINANQDQLRKEGIDVDKLWQLHADLAAKTGVNGNIRSSEAKTYTINGKTYTIGG